MKAAAIIATAVILVGGAFGNYLRYHEQVPETQPSLDAIPLRAGAYNGEERRFADYNYEVLQADTTTLRRYVGPGGEVYWLFVAYFSSQKYGSQMHSPKHCLPGGGWLIENIDEVDMITPDGTRRVNRLTVSHGKQQQAMFYWYQTRSGAITDEFQLKWSLVKSSLLFRPTDAAFIRLTLPLIGGDMETATVKATEFFNTFHESLQRALPLTN